MNRIPINLTVNGRTTELSVEPNATLADSLREQAGTHSVHLGCEHGVCGACNVYLNGAVVRSCLTLTATCDGMEITTLEGLSDATAAALKDAMHRCHGLQCGFCTPGMIITGHDMLTRKLCNSETEIRQQLCGNICRCTGYQAIVTAIASAQEEISP